jgi:hypothetical protein
MTVPKTEIAKILSEVLCANVNLVLLEMAKHAKISMNANLTNLIVQLMLTVLILLAVLNVTAEPDLSSMKLNVKILMNVDLRVLVAIRIVTIRSAHSNVSAQLDLLVMETLVSTRTSVIITHVTLKAG